MTRLAFLMPGQGSQAVGMGRALSDAFPEARARFEEADRILDRPLTRTMWEGPEETLKETEWTQPALYAVSCAAADVLAARGVAPAAAAGHSVGEYAAHYAAGSIDFADGLRLVAVRAAAMGAAARARPGGMAAVLGPADDEVEAICAAAAAETGRVVVPANFNAPGQVVISGETDAVERAAALAQERGAKVRLLNVSGAWHSPLMADATRALAGAIPGAPWRAPRVPVVANVDAAVHADPEAVRRSLVEQVEGAVRWSATVLALGGLGAESYLEVGSGAVLKGLMKRIVKGSRAASFGDPKDLEAALALAGSAA